MQTSTITTAADKDLAPGTGLDVSDPQELSSCDGQATQPVAGRHPLSVLRFAATTCMILAVDLVTKWLAFEHVAAVPVRLTRETSGLAYSIPHHDPTVLIPGVLSLKLTANTGAVFGWGKGAQWLFVAVSVFASIVVCRFFYTSRPKARMLHLALGLIMAGALGNMYDRVRFYAVRDMLHLFPETSIWPWIFNIADAALMVGVGLIIVMVWRTDHNLIRPNPKPPPPATTTVEAD